MMRQNQLGGLLKWRNLRIAYFMLGTSPFLSGLVPRPNYPVNTFKHIIPGVWFRKGNAA
jgi:hypothetical protein